MDGLVASREDGLAGYEEGGLPSVAFIHHQDHVEKPVENLTQGLDNRHQFRLDTSPLMALRTNTVDITHASDYV